jgi:RimJ/RimL family protein N-acetyltransferase
VSTAAAQFSEAITLRNGSAAVLRAIRPDDRAHLQAAFRALEPESIYLRYFSYKRELTETDLDRLCAPDFVVRVVLVATQQVAAAEVIVAAGGYVAHDAPDGVREAEVAFSVEEDVQGQGIASKMLAALAGIARGTGIGRFDAEVLRHNAAMLRVFERSGLPMHVEPSNDGVVHLSLSLAGRPSPAGASR